MSDLASDAVRAEEVRLLAAMAAVLYRLNDGGVMCLEYWHRPTVRALLERYELLD